MHDMARKLQHGKDGGRSMGVSASALGSKDSLYTIQDAPVAPQHRIAAAPSQVSTSARAGWAGRGGGPCRQLGQEKQPTAGMHGGRWGSSGSSSQFHRARIPTSTPLPTQGYDRYGEQNFSRNQVQTAW